MRKNIDEQPAGQEIFYPETSESWRRWLEKNHLSTNSVWVVFYSKSRKKPSVTWSQAVDVALCYGWIDSKKIKIDTDCSHQFFSRRKPGSTWSKINKQKVEKLLEEGKMRQAGIDAVEKAKQNGSWVLLDRVEELLIPDDLAQAFARNPEAEAFYSSLSRSARKMILHWVTFAKRAETRDKRVTEVVNRTSQNLKPPYS